MASWRYILLKAILIGICLDISSIVLATVVRNSKTSKYDSYNLDKGPVIYEAYYPDSQDQKKHYFDRNTILETSFQVPSHRFVYSTEITNRPVRKNESSIVNDERRILSKKQAIKIRRNYNFTNKFVPFHDKRFSKIVEEDKKDIQNVNIKEISKLIRRAISRDLKSWNALETYLQHTNNQTQSVLQPEMYFKKNRENEEDYNYPFQVNQRNFDALKQLNSEVSRKLEIHDIEQLQPTYFEEVDASENIMKDKMINNDMQAANTPVNVISNSSIENIFQPRPQLIRYTFFRKFIPRFNERIVKTMDESTLRNYSNNFIREKIVNDNRDKQIKENVKITSIEVSKLPRHKTRHHHDKWPKRYYFIHRSQSTIYPINKINKK